MDRGRQLGLGLATALVAGNMVGSGIYLLPASLAAIGSVSIIGWVLALIGALILGGAFSLLSIARPDGKGLLSHVRDAFGPGTGYVSTVLYWVNCWVGNVAIALGVTGSLGAIFPPLVATPYATALTTITILWMFVGINMIGPRFVAKFEGWSLAAGLLPIFAVGVVGWWFFDAARFAAAWNPSGQPIASGISQSLILVFWSFLGLESASIAARLVSRPERNVPIATLGGIALAGIIYIVACDAILGIVPLERLRNSTAPFADAVAGMSGASVATLIAACAALKAAGTLGGFILMTEQSTPIREGAPTISRNHVLVATGLLMTVAVAASSSPTLGQQFTVMTNVAVVLSLTVYALGCAALIRLSGKTSHRVVALAGIAFSLFTIGVSDPALWSWSIAIIVGATLLYFALTRLRPLSPASQAGS